MKQNFVQGTFILVAAGLITRGLGTIYRIFLSRFIGSEAIGLYQMAFPTLIMLITIVTAGMPVAVSKIVAEAEAKNDPYLARKILRLSLTLVIIISIFISFLFYLSIPFITKYLLRDARVYLTLQAIVPIIPIISVSSILRGYFQGKQNMIPTATSLIVETLFRMISGIILSLIMLPYGIEYASFGAMIGMVIGEIAGFFILLIQFLLSKNNIKQPRKQTFLYNKKNIYNDISRIALPVTTSQITGSLAYFIEPSIVAYSLAIAGISTSLATAQYGQLAGMALLIIYFPNVITYSLSQSLIPSVSEAAARNDTITIYKRLHQALKIAYVIGLPAAVIMYVMADPIAIVLFDTPQVGQLIKIIAPFAIFLYLRSPLAATLQGLDLAKVSMTNSIIGAVLKTIAILILASRPQLGIDGVAMSLNLGITLVTALHFRSIVRIIGYAIEIKPLISTSFSAIFMGYISYYLMAHTFIKIPLGLRLIMVVLIGGIVYFYLLLILRVMKKHDLERIPWLGNKITRIIPWK